MKGISLLLILGITLGQIEQIYTEVEGVYGVGFVDPEPVMEEQYQGPQPEIWGIEMYEVNDLPQQIYENESQGDIEVSVQEIETIEMDAHLRRSKVKKQLRTQSVFNADNQEKLITMSECNLLELIKQQIRQIY